jgi:hypothetical protein
MAKIGRPATGHSPLISLRLPAAWLKQIDHMKGTRSQVARELIGSALAARKQRPSGEPLQISTA